MVDIMTATEKHKYRVRYVTVKGVTIQIPAYDIKQALAIGKSMSHRETFKVYTDDGTLKCIYIDGKPVQITF